MNVISVRLPESLHDFVRELAERDNVSINTFILLATEDYLKQRAKHGDRAKFDAALSKVADVPPDEEDGW